MQAVTDFAATRERIAYAVEVFREGFEARQAKAEALRLAWVEEKTAKAWFTKREQWEARSLGKGGDIFENLTMKYEFIGKVPNYYWYEARYEQAEKLLRKFDCAVDTLEAFEVRMSDDDLALLSISLQSALEN